MTRAFLVTAAFVAAVAVWGLSLPPRRTVLQPGQGDGTVRGLLHVHSRASDGRGTPDEIAAAAARAGLQFVFLTDHGDATRAPQPPAYRDGVLLIDAVEISTRGGHYVALGMPKSPYPLGGDAAAVVEDVHRLGGFGIVAHPDSPKDELRWTDWSLPVDAVELINPDTSWRVHAFTGTLASKWLLLRSLLTYPVRPAETIAQLLTETRAVREDWMALAAERAVVGLAGADAHAKVALRNTEPGDNRYSVPMPSYEASFQSLSVHVVPAQAMTGDAAADAQALLAGIRRGHAYLAVDGWATPASFVFTATAAGGAASEGETLAAGSPVSLQVRSNAPAGFRTVVWNGNRQIADRTETAFELAAGADPGVYTVEIRRSGDAGQPAWITSNPVYVRAAAAAHPPTPAAPAWTQVGPPLFDGRTTAGWSYESDRTSLAVVDTVSLVDAARVRLRYGLAGGTPVGQYAAAAVRTPAGVDNADAVAFSIRAEVPMRVSVQVRAEIDGRPPARWERSVFVDVTEQDRAVRFADMKPVGETPTERPPGAAVRAIIFVVDTTNTAPGASGRLFLGDVRLVRAR